MLTMEYIKENEKTYQVQIEELTNKVEYEQRRNQRKDKEIERLHSIIKEVREILKYHLSNPSGTKNGWHIDIWNSEDISKLNEYLEILDKENK